MHRRKYKIELDAGFIVRDGGSDPEETAIQNQNVEIAHRVLKSIDREVGRY